MIAFCRGIQAAAPVDSYVTPDPVATCPATTAEVIMAAGAFVQGSSIELSADGPIRPPYAVYFQGGLTWYHAKLGILMSLQKMVDAGLVNAVRVHIDKFNTKRMQTAMWFWFSLIALLCWSGSDLFSKIGCREAERQDRAPENGHGGRHGDGSARLPMRSSSTAWRSACRSL